jgi:hypothetical protein
MKRSAPLLATGALVLALVSLPGRADAAVPSNALTVGHTLTSGHYLRSANGAYHLTMRPDGDLAIMHAGTTTWRLHTGRSGAHLSVRASGNLAMFAGTTLRWSTGTAGSSPHNEVVITNVGNIELRNVHGVIWSNRISNGCRTNTAAKRMIVSIGRQLARMCARNQQILTTPVTTGASARGAGTPTGTWHIQSKQRNRFLYPASGGAYYVHYWMPYAGDYGFHDSPWQQFPYGSSLYRTQGSHGCVHLPGAMMVVFFNWAPLGTAVTIGA